MEKVTLKINENIIRRITEMTTQLTFKTVDGDVGARLDKMFGVKSSFLRVEPSHCLLPPQFVFLGPRIRDMTVYEDDVWMVSYPRTGKIN